MKIKWWRYNIFRWWHHRLPQWIAFKLPNIIVYYATIRLGANATSGQYSNQVVPELLFMEALKRWELKELKDEQKQSKRSNTSVSEVSSPSTSVQDVRTIDRAEREAPAESKVGKKK